MGKFVNAIIGAALIAAGAIFAPLAIIGSALLISGIVSGTVSLLFGPKSLKPQQAESQISDPAAARCYGYGTRRVFGNRDFWGNAADGVTVDVISYVDGQAHAVRAAYLNDNEVTIVGGVVQALDDGSYAGGVVQAGYNLGLPTETAHAAVVAKLPGIWTEDHRGDGVVSGYLIKSPVKSKDFLAVYPQGDNVALSLVIDLQLCFDPREDDHDIDDQSTWAWTENSVLHLLHYFIVRRGINYATQILPQIDKWIAAADICDQDMALNAGGTEKRYRACILYDSQAKPYEVANSIIETFDGWYCQNERDELIVYAGGYYEPTVSLGPEHIIDYTHQANLLDEDVYNEFKIRYYSAAHDYNQPECQPWRDETDISKRGLNSQPFQPQVPSFTQGRRLAKAMMARQNAPDRGQIKTNYAGRIAEGERFIRINITEAGTTLFEGPVEVTGITRALDTGGLLIDWVRATPDAYAWNPATEDGYGAPIGTFPTPEPLEAPTIDSIEQAGDPGSTSALLEITGPDREDLTWFIHWRLDGATVWGPGQEYPDIDDSPAVQLLANSLPLDVEIEFQVSYQVGDGRVSPWSNTETVTLDGA